MYMSLRGLTQWPSEEKNTVLDNPQIYSGVDLLLGCLERL